MQNMPGGLINVQQQQPPSSPWMQQPRMNINVPPPATISVPPPGFHGPPPSMINSAPSRPLFPGAVQEVSYACIHFT